VSTFTANQPARTHLGVVKNVVETPAEGVHDA